MLLDHPRLGLSIKRKISINLLIALLFVLVGNCGLLFTNYTGNSSPFWPPSGLALAMVVIFGMVQVIPGIALGVLLLALQSQAPIITIIGLVLGALLEACLSTILLHAIGHGKFRFRKPIDIFFFIGVAGFLSPLISSTVDVTFLYIGNLIELDLVPKVWSRFFLANSLGIVIFTPMILAFFSKKTKKINVPEAIFITLLLIGASYFAFEGQGVKKFLVLPILIWTAIRFSFIGVSFASMVVTLMATWRSTFLWGVFDAYSPENDLIWIQFMAIGAAVIGYFMATISEVQLEAEFKEKELNLNLQHKKIAEEAFGILDQSIHKSPIGLALIDRDYKYIRINESLASYNQLSCEEHLGRTVSEVTPENAPGIEEMIDKVFLTEESFMNIPYEGYSLSRKCQIAGLVSYYPIRHPSTNEIFGVGFTYQDLTEQVKVQNLLRENQDFLTFAQIAGKIGAFEWDVVTHKILWTGELENIYGLGRGEFCGLYDSWLKCIHPDDVEGFAAVVRRMGSGLYELNHEFRIITKSQDVKWILARGKMLKDVNGLSVKFIGINIDLTEQKSIEHKLRLTEANLLHALSVRDEFVAIASHELKTPLTSLKLQIQLHQRGVIRNDPNVYTPEKVRDLLDKNSRQIDRLTRLVDDMLDISRIKTGKLSLKKEVCELTCILYDVLGRTRDQFENSGSGQPIIENIGPAVGEWDNLRIDQVITNIITNAIRYGQGKPICISTRNYQESVRISVRDSGLGIPKSDQEKIFKRYERGLLTREVSGLGLGLFITQQIVEAHGGKIWIESELGAGSTFHVELPRITTPLISDQEIEDLILMEAK